MKRILLILFFGLILNTSITPNIPPSFDNSMIVISTAGLHLRENPSSDAKSLHLVSYGSRVKVISEALFGADTIRINIDDQIVGQWKMVSYNGLEGYMFRPYLLSINKKVFPINTINNNYALWYGRKTCFNNLQYDEKLKWLAFGYDGKKEIIQEIHPTYYWEKGPIENYIVQELNLDFQAKFVIGIRKGLDHSPNGINLEAVNIDQYNELCAENKDDNKMFYDHNNGNLIYC